MARYPYEDESYGNKYEQPSASSRPKPVVFHDGKEQGSYKVTLIALGIFIASFLFGFTGGTTYNQGTLVGMGVGVLASIVSFFGIAKSKGAWPSILVAVIVTIPAIISCCFLILIAVMSSNM